MKKFLMVFLICIFYVFDCNNIKDKQNSQNLNGYDKMRQEMVEKQLKSRGIKDKQVLKALETIPRHVFVPDNLADEAYSDGPLPIGSGQTISQPYIVAYMSEQLDLQKSDKVLEIGTGSGYQAAVLAELVEAVFTIEIIPELSENAQKVLNMLEYGNITFKVGNGYYGWPEYAPYDAIIVTAAADEIPQPLIDQLKVGGHLIIPVGEFFQELILLTKEDKGIRKEKKLPVRFVPLTGEPD